MGKSRVQSLLYLIQSQEFAEDPSPAEPRLPLSFVYHGASWDDVTQAQ